MKIFNFFLYAPLVIGLFLLTIMGLIAIFKEKYRKNIIKNSIKILLTMILLSVSTFAIGGLICEWFGLPMF